MICANFGDNSGDIHLYLCTERRKLKTLERFSIPSLLPFLRVLSCSVVLCLFFFLYSCSTASSVLHFFEAIKCSYCYINLESWLCMREAKISFWNLFFPLYKSRIPQRGFTTRVCSIFTGMWLVSGSDWWSLLWDGDYLDSKPCSDIASVSATPY